MQCSSSNYNVTTIHRCKCSLFNTIMNSLIKRCLWQQHFNGLFWWPSEKLTHLLFLNFKFEGKIRKENNKEKIWMTQTTRQMICSYSAAMLLNTNLYGNVFLNPTTSVSFRVDKCAWFRISKKFFISFRICSSVVVSTFF